MLPPQFEVNLPPELVRGLLAEIFAGWEVLWDSENPRYGGSGAPPAEDEGGGWRLPGNAAVVLRPASPGKTTARTARKGKKK